MMALAISFSNPDDRLRRRVKHEISPYVFTGVSILHPRLFASSPDEEAFSINVLWDRAIKQGRVSMALNSRVYVDACGDP